MTTTTPSDIEQLKKSLCSEIKNGVCIDETPRTIIINQPFDFTDGEVKTEEDGCDYSGTPSDCETPLKVLNKSGMCDQSKLKKVPFSAQGKDGLVVGSNKIIKAEEGGQLNGKGLRIERVKNVEVHGLSITNINPHLYMGGIAIELIGAENILIDGNYFKNIGWQMIMTRSGSSTGVTISNNRFDGETEYSATCDGTSHYLWMFTGESERIAIVRNRVSLVSGRAPYINANGSKTMVHLVENTFTDVKHDGAIHVADTDSSVLAEGNMFINVDTVVFGNNGHVHLPINQKDAGECAKHLNRPCKVNVVTNSGGADGKTSEEALKRFKSELYK